MAKIQIQLAGQDDLEAMVSLDHTVSSSYSYKLNFARDGFAWTYGLERVRLPRSINLPYPRDEQSLLKSWEEASGVYVGKILDELVAYATFCSESYPRTLRVTNLVVAHDIRRKGVGTSMLTACEVWALNHALKRVLLELPARNDPAISLSCKNGYELCGHLDQFFPSGEMALFFEKHVG
ncbi:MAG TPA: GNAT family N-acetyltransferase [Anaerolineaceae bacterium]|nr:GNAT family N-acetyltransferase [Anaerolineaceae bacterium]